jgi:hypothetical protein
LEEAQVDWGHFGKVAVGGTKRTLLDMTLESFLRGHVLAFQALGGVPRALLYDNLKSVVLERAGGAIRFHPRSPRARRPTCALTPMTTPSPTPW